MSDAFLEITGSEEDIKKFFITPLPTVGQIVYLTYVGKDKDGGMQFQLAVKGDSFV